MLTVLACLLPAFCLLAMGTALGIPGLRGGRVYTLCLILCAAGAAAALSGLLSGAPAARLVLPFGLPGQGVNLAADALSLWFLLIVFASGAAASVYARSTHDRSAVHPAALLVPYPVFIAAMALTVLAADGFTLLVGFEAMSLASWALVLAKPEDPDSQRAARLYLLMAGLGALCLIPAFGLMAQAGDILPDLRFEAIRRLPLDGWKAGAVVALTLIGAGSKAGLAPLHVWLPLAHPAAPSHVSALMSAAMTKVALYVLIRILFDLLGPVTPVWWSLPLLAMGAGAAVLGALRATQEGDMKVLLACSTIENIGLIAAALGLALLFRATDQTPLAALALGAGLLHALNHGVFKTLLFLGAGAAQHEGGSRKLDLLGGLIRRMPVTAWCVIAAAAAAAALPPLNGFASEWMILQLALAAPRNVGFGLQIVLTVLVVMLGLAAALAAAAMVRMIGIAFLGRPRMPRAAAAVEMARPVRITMTVLAGLCIVLGLVPGAMLGLLDPVLAVLGGAHVDPRVDATGMVVATNSYGYVPLVISALLACCLFLVWRAVQRIAGTDQARAIPTLAPAWDCGFIPAPRHLPFGDPQTQYGAGSFAQPIRRMLGGAILRAREQVDMPAPGEARAARHTLSWHDPAFTFVFDRIAAIHAWLARLADLSRHLTIRHTLGVVFATLILLLVMIAVLERLETARPEQIVQSHAIGREAAP